MRGNHVPVFYLCVRKRIYIDTQQKRNYERIKSLIKISPQHS